jgi:hypothetical protein
VRIQELQKTLPPGTSLTWLVYRDAYVRRAREDAQPLTAHVESVRDTYGVRLVWFRTGDDVIGYINNGMNRRNMKVSGFEYFGHSNKRNWMFDYSNRLDGGVAEPLCLHIDHLRQIKSSSFARGAYARSWGCHSGEEYSAAWARATGVRMIGAVGKTDYSGGGIPIISTAGGYWTQ